MDHFALLPAPERAIVFRETAARLRVGSATIVEKDFWVCWALHRIFLSTKLPGPLFKGGTSLSKVYKVIERFSEDVDIVLDRHASDSPESRTLPTSRAQTSAIANSMNWRASVRRPFMAPSDTNSRSPFARSSGKRIGRSAKIRPTQIGRASCSPIRSVSKRTCTALAAIFALSFDWSSDAEGTCGRRSGSRFSPTLPTHFPVSSLSQLRKFTFYDRNAHSGRRQRCSMRSTTRERRRPGYRAIITTSPVCTGMNTGRMR
jgi:hypothetical protein